MAKSRYGSSRDVKGQAKPESERPLEGLTELAELRASFICAGLVGIVVDAPESGRSRSVEELMRAGCSYRFAHDPPPAHLRAILRRPDRRRSRARSARTPCGLTAAGTARFCTQVGGRSCPADVVRGYPIRPRARLGSAGRCRIRTTRARIGGRGRELGGGSRLPEFAGSARQGPRKGVVGSIRRWDVRRPDPWCPPRASSGAGRFDSRPTVTGAT